MGGQGFYIFKEKRNPISNLIILLTVSLFPRPCEFWVFIGLSLFHTPLAETPLLVFVIMVTGVLVGAFNWPLPTVWNAVYKNYRISSLKINAWR